MRCNFSVRYFVDLDGDFGTIDVHIAYKLASFERDIENRTFRMDFKASKYCRIAPRAFEINFTDVGVVEIDGMPSDLTDYCIHQVVFMDAEDRDYDYVPGDESPAPRQHIVFIGEHGRGERATVRVQSALAELRLGR